MALSFVINKIVNQRRVLKFMQEEMDDERRQERVHKQLANLDQPMSINYMPPPVDGPRPAVYLSRLQRQSLKVTWIKLSDKTRKGRTMTMLTDVFERMSRDKLVRGVYSGVNLVNALATQKSSRTRMDSCLMHARTLYGLINAFVHSTFESPLEDGYRVPELERLADYHCPLAKNGFPSSAFDRFGELLVDVFLMHEIVQSCPDGKKAWMLFFAYLVDGIRAEFDKQLAQKRRSRSAVRLSRQHTLPPISKSSSIGLAPPLPKTSLPVGIMSVKKSKAVHRNPLKLDEETASDCGDSPPPQFTVGDGSNESDCAKVTQPVDSPPAKTDSEVVTRIDDSAGRMSRSSTFPMSVRQHRRYLLARNAARQSQQQQKQQPTAVARRARCNSIGHRTCCLADCACFNHT